MNTMELVDCTEDYWDFVRVLRMNREVAHGFIEGADISPEDQVKYMTKNAEHYRVCLSNGRPCGYVGVIDRDIRVCVDPNYWRMGVGKFMIKKCREIWPKSFARVKVDNLASLALFKSCGFEPEYIILK